MKEYIISIPTHRPGEPDSIVVNGEFVGEITRCKDCRFREQITNMRGEEMYACNNRLTGIFQEFLHKPDWFCADGRNKNE